MVQRLLENKSENLIKTALGDAEFFMFKNYNLKYARDIWSIL